MTIECESIYYNHLQYENPDKNPQYFMRHSHSTTELIYFETGDANYVIEDRKYTLKKGDLVLIRPGKYHYVEINSHATYTRFNIAFDYSVVERALVKSIPEEVEILNCPEGSIIAEIFKRMDYYNATLDEKAFVDVLKGLLKEIFYNIFLTYKDTLNTPTQISPLLSKALEYMNKNLLTIKSIKEVSDFVFITEQYFFKLFKTQLKISPKKYINSKRLIYAQKLIQRGKKPIEIYYECGFETYVGFYKQYIKEFGYSPSKEKVVTTIK